MTFRDVAIVNLLAAVACAISLGYALTTHWASLAAFDATFVVLNVLIVAWALLTDDFVIYYR